MERAPPRLDSEALSELYEAAAREACPILQSPWRMNRPAAAAQGWKLHVSATILSATEVLARARTVLEPAAVPYKCAASLGALAILNTGLPGFSQTGKFMTVYCQSADEALVLAEALDAATAGLSGPAVPFDLPYRRGGLVHYRYGSFHERRIRDARGRWRTDRREAGFAVPDWVANPFPDPAPADDADGPLGLSYLVTHALAQRGKGGVYEALDVGSAPARLCVLKEGRPDGETQWDGTDGFWRVGHEGRVLRDLRGHGVPVPEVLDEFEQGGNRYLVLERIEGAPLVDRNARKAGRRPWREAREAWRLIEAVLQQIHDAGWVWRDCKPDNLLREGNGLRPIDFEGACRVDETSVVPWGTFAFTPRPIAEGDARSPGWAEDAFAAAAIAFLLGTGAPTDPAAEDRAARLVRTRCPADLRARLEADLVLGVAAATPPQPTPVDPNGR